MNLAQLRALWGERDARYANLRARDHLKEPAVQAVRWWRLQEAAQLTGAERVAAAEEARTWSHPDPAPHYRHAGGRQEWGNVRKVAP